MAWPLRRLLKYGALGSVVLGSAVSLRGNDYRWDSIAVVRLARAGCAVVDIGMTYKKGLYFKPWPDKQCEEYVRLKSECHTRAAQKLLQLICTNKGVYIKVGQHIGALEYLLPTEYVATMKILHSNAPQNHVNELYKVIRQDLKVEVSLFIHLRVTRVTLTDAFFPAGRNILLVLAHADWHGLLGAGAQGHVEGGRHCGGRKGAAPVRARQLYGRHEDDGDVREAAGLGLSGL